MQPVVYTVTWSIRNNSYLETYLFSDRDKAINWIHQKVKKLFGHDILHGFVAEPRRENVWTVYGEYGEAHEIQINELSIDWELNEDINDSE